ncbi:MAG TPA: helix-turn-helix domain-containing protein [Solirubrobacterales bacterium]|jgi:DNA-binding transcriptional ArsR family regulator
MAGIDDRGHARDKKFRQRRAVLGQPSRNRIARLFLGEEELSVGEVAVRLEQVPARVAYHLRLLRRHGVVDVAPKRNPRPPHYRWGRDAEWAREVLVSEQEEESDG